MSKTSKYSMASASSRYIFPWFARCNGGIFFATGGDIVYTCPFCGHNGTVPDETGRTGDNAFESGHVRRVWGEEFGIR